MREHDVRAQDVFEPTARVRVQIYSKLAAAFSVPITTAQPGTAMLSLLFPGFFIQPHLDPADPKTQYLIANAVNGTLACSWVAELGAATISDVYKGILDGKEVPLVHLTPDQKAKLTAAEDYLFGPDGEPSPAYQSYQRYRLAYFEALDTYEAALATEHNGGPAVPASVAEALAAAKQAWREDGHQDEVDLAIDTVEIYQGLEPLVYWKNLATRYREWTRYVDVDSAYQYTTTIPPYERWFDEFGWSSFSFQPYDFERQRRSGGVGLRPGCCCGGDFASILPIETGRPEVTDLAMSDIRLTCKLRRIQITRPWLDSSVFFSRAWRWSPGSIGYGSTISTGGDLAGVIVPTGTMPVFPGTAVMARDLEARWSDPKMARKAAALAAAGQDISIGPFRLTGARTGQDEHYVWQPDPQIIGFIGTILPRCPNPDATLPWPLSNVLLTRGRRDPVPAPR